MLTQEMLRQIVCADLDSEFIRSLSIEIGWRYRDLYVAIAQMPFLTEAYRNELFNRQRGGVVAQAMVNAAQKHGVPCEIFRLINGQHKILLKTGRVVLISESIAAIEDHPKAADYKIQLSEVHGYLRQLELDLGDRPYMIRDWSGSVLATILHAPVGLSFKRSSKDLGVLLLGVADASYNQWLLRLDLHKVAMFGSKGKQSNIEEVGRRGEMQTDKVLVRLRRVSKEEGRAK